MAAYREIRVAFPARISCRHLWNSACPEVTLEALSKKGFTAPTAIQAKTIPLLLAGDTDIVGQAMTGSG